MLRVLKSFDTFRAFFISILLCLAFYFGFKYDKYPEAFAFAAGMMVAYFPNVEGNNTERFWGMVAGSCWAIVTLLFFNLLNPLVFEIKLILILILAFFSSMLSVFGHRGVMVSFGGLFSLVIGQALSQYKIRIEDEVFYSVLGSSVYITVAFITHNLYQTRNISFLISEQMLWLESYMRFKHNDLYLKEKHKPALGLLHIMVKINETQELLRGMLMHKRKLKLAANTKNTQLAIFKDLVDIYEMAIASPSTESLTDNAINVELRNSFENLSDKILFLLKSLAVTNERGKNIGINELENTESAWLETDKTLGELSNKNHLVNLVVNENLLILRSLLDYYALTLEKIRSIYDRIRSGVLPLDEDVYVQFITPQSYNVKALKENFNLQSPTFRFSARITTAFLLSFLIGYLVDLAYTHWILVTVLVIMRPAYVLTKRRAYHRLSGTIVGLLLTYLCFKIGLDSSIWAGAACFSIFLGFVYINKNYTLASGFITFSLMSLLKMQNQLAEPLMQKRLLLSLVGVLIVFAVNYLVFPVWQQSNFRIYLKKAIKSNLQYFNAVYDIYYQKKNLDDAYRLSRKKALVDNGNLASVFENLQKEPQSKRQYINQFYAIILLNHNFIGATAGFSTFVQNHQTTEVSEQFDKVKTYIKQNLEMALAYLDGKELKVKDNSPEIAEALEFLNEKYHKLNLEPQDYQQNKLLEGRVLIDQLQNFVSVSENIKHYAQLLNPKSTSLNSL